MVEDNTYRMFCDRFDNILVWGYYARFSVLSHYHATFHRYPYVRVFCSLRGLSFSTSLGPPSSSCEDFLTCVRWVHCQLAIIGRGYAKFWRYPTVLFAMSVGKPWVFLNSYRLFPFSDYVELLSLQTIDLNCAYYAVGPSVA